jgi:hypothetical protein
MQLLNKYPQRNKQRGNGLIFAILGIALTSLLTAQQFERSRVEANRQLGEKEATVQQRLSKATNDLVQDYLQNLQQAQVIPAGATPITPVISGTSISYDISIAQLKTLGALPATWDTLQSPTTGGNYTIRLDVTPPGCTPFTACGVEGSVQTALPLLKDGIVNGPALGVFSDKIGADSGVTLTNLPATVVGWANTWNAPNRAPGSPAGILSHRVGTSSVGFNRFLRVRDPRNPEFQGGVSIFGNVTGTTSTLIVSGNTSITGSLVVSGTSSFANDITVVDPATGNACVRVQRSGRIDIDCAGILNAKDGTFTGPNGNVRVGTTGTLFSVDTTGRVRGEQGFFAAVGSLFGDNNLGIRAASNIFTVQTSANIDAIAVHDAGRFGARNSVATPMLGLSDPVSIGAACSSPGSEVPSTLVTNPATTVLRALVGGGLASCVNGRWTPIFDVVTPGASCAAQGDGVTATSSVDGRQLICRNGVFMLLNDLLSSFVLFQTYAVTHNDFVPYPACGQMGATTGQPFPLMRGQVEGSANASFERRTVPQATGWSVVLTDSAGVPLAGNPASRAILEVFCYY